jgi:phage-related protein
MAFEVFKMGKLSDRLEGEAYEWVAWQIQETYGLELTKNEYGYEQDIVEVMTEEHVKEIEEYLDNTYKDKLWIEPYANTALNSICDRWRDENDVPWEPIEEEPKKGDIDVGEIMPDGYPKTFEVES